MSFESGSERGERLSKFDLGFGRKFQMRGAPDWKFKKRVQFGGAVQQEGELMRIAAFVLAGMHAEVMTDRQERFHKGHDRQDKQV